MLTFLENVFPPIPSELIIPLAGFVAANGTLRLDVVIIAATTGSLAGAWLWYEVGRRVGERRLRRWVDSHGAWLTLSADDVDRAQQWFQRHGRVAVLLLQSNYQQVGDYINVATNVLLAGFGALLLWRYVRCWRSARRRRAAEA